MRLAGVVLLLLVAAAAALLTAGPAAARSADDTAPPAADPVVQVYVDAAKQYVAAAGPLVDEAVGRENDAIGACQPLVDAAPARVQPQLADLIANDLAAVTFRAMLSPYGRLVTQLTQADATDPVLRGAADGAWTLKQLQLPLLKPRLGVCRLVRQWKAARWGRSFPVRHPREFAAAVVTPSQQTQALDAQQAIEAAGRRLEELGATQGDAMLFSSAVGSSLI